MRNFVIFFDIFLIVFILSAPISFVESTLWLLYIFASIGLFAHVITNEPLKESFTKPSWWIYYDILTDLIILIIIYYIGLINLFWLAFFMSGAKHFIKRTPYETNSN